MTIDKQRIQSIVEGMTYKPGWSFFLTWELDIPHLNMQAVVPDIDCPERLTTLNAALVMPTPIGPQECKMWISHAINYVEEHDHREFLRFNGVRLFRPHSDAGDWV